MTKVNGILYLDKVRERASIPGYKELQSTGKKTDVIGDYEEADQTVYYGMNVRTVLYHEQLFSRC